MCNVPSLETETLIRLMKSILEIAKLLIDILIKRIGHLSLPMDLDTQKVNVLVDSDCIVR